MNLSIVGTLRIALVAAMAVSLSGAFMSNGTQAAFVAQTTNPNNTFQAGTLKFTASSASALFDLQVAGNVTLLNSPNFTATVVDNTQITLTWTDINGASSSTLYRCAGPVSCLDDATPDTTLTTVTAAGSYPDTGLTPGTTYSYRLVHAGAGFYTLTATTSSGTGTVLAPGDIRSNILTLQQTGSLQAPIMLAMSAITAGSVANACDSASQVGITGQPTCGSVPLADQLEIAIWEDAATDVCIFPASGTPMDSQPCGYGTLTAAATALASGVQAAPADLTTHNIKVQAKLPSTANNGVQGNSSQFTLTWTATK